MAKAVQDRQAASTRAEVIKPLFRAEGLVRGVLVPERDVLIGYDRQVYPVTIAPALRRWFHKNPKAMTDGRDYYRVFPRSTKDGRLRFYVADAPSAPIEELDLVPYHFVISGTVLNQRSLSTKRSPDCVVVRVKPNKVVAPGERDLPENRQHLLFLRGRVVPAAKYIGKHCTFFCELQQGQLWINGCALAEESSVERVDAGGAVLPWPFRDRNDSTWRLVHKWNQMQPPFPDAPDAREQMVETLKAWSKSIREEGAKAAKGTILSRDLDRLGQIARRLLDRVTNADSNSLRSLICQRGLLALTSKIRDSLSETSDSAPSENLTPDNTVTTATAPVDRKTDLLGLLGQPLMDEAIIWTTKITRPQLIARVKQFWAEGKITPEIEARSRSYQLKKHKPDT